MKNITQELGIESIDELRRKPIRKINQLLKEAGLSYFETFIETQIPDIRQYFDDDQVQLIRVKNGTKTPIDKDWTKKKLTPKELLSHNGNFGIVCGHNHLIKGKSIACIDIDGIKIPKMTKKDKELLTNEQKESIKGLTDQRIEEITQESKDYLLTCILSALPDSMIVKTQSGGYHILVWNKTLPDDNTDDKFHHLSRHLQFPQDCPVPELRGMSLLNSIEMFTHNHYVVLAGSFIKNNKTGETRTYELMDIAENTHTLKGVGISPDVNEQVKKHLLSIGFEWVDEPVQEQEQETPQGRKRKSKAKDEILNPYGILKELNDNEIDEVVNILQPFFKNKQLEGMGHYTVLALGGYFSHTITEESGIKIIRKLLKKSGFQKDNIKAGIKTIKENYKRKGRKTGLNTAFKNIQDKMELSDKETETLKKRLQYICYPSMNKANKTKEDLEILIRQSLAKNYNPSVKMLSDYLNKQDKFFIDYDSGIKYKLTDKGFEEIGVKDIADFINDTFGENEIRIKTIKEAMDYITHSLMSDYNIIIFDNGTLDTSTGEFKKDFYPIDRLPKIKTHLKYIENAGAKYKETKLYKEFKEILDSRWKDNENTYYKCVGVSAMGINESDCFFIIDGVPNSRKTTLLTPLKRFFSYSEVKLQIIAANKRFEVLPCIRKDINIDDDLTSTNIRDAGFLKTFVSGAGGTVERKGENIPARLTAETTPKLWGCANELPSIFGEGIERRTCLILAENPIKNGRKSYQTEILRGDRDSELSLFFSYAIQYYLQERDKPFLTDTQRMRMLREWNWKSYPAKVGASIVFMDTDEYMDYLREKENISNVRHNERDNLIEYDEKTSKGLTFSKDIETWTPVQKVNNEFKKFYKISMLKGKIFKEQSKPSKNMITKALENAGFFQTKKNIKDDYGHYQQVRIYEDCIINPEWEKEVN